MNGHIPHLPRLGVKFPTPALVLKSNSLLPGKGRLSNARGMPVCVRVCVWGGVGGGGGGWGGMLRLQIDRCNTKGCISMGNPK